MTQKQINKLGERYDRKCRKVRQKFYQAKNPDKWLESQYCFNARVSLEAMHEKLAKLRPDRYGYTFSFGHIVS